MDTLIYRIDTGLKNQLFTRKKEENDMKVTTYTINKGQKNQYFGLKNAEDNQVLWFAPNNWKTEKGALNWAKREGLEIVK